MEVVMKVSIRHPKVSGYVLFLDLIAGYSGTFIKKKRKRKTSARTIYSFLCASYISIQFTICSKPHYSLCSMGFETCLADTSIFKIHCIKISLFLPTYPYNTSL